MSTFLIIYILIGAFVALPVTENLGFLELFLVMLTWPVALLYAVVSSLKGG